MNNRKKKSWSLEEFRGLNIRLAPFPKCLAFFLLSDKFVMSGFHLNAIKSLIIVHFKNVEKKRFHIIADFELWCQTLRSPNRQYKQCVFVLWSQGSICFWWQHKTRQTVKQLVKSLIWLFSEPKSLHNLKNINTDLERRSWGDDVTSFGTIALRIATICVAALPAGIRTVLHQRAAFLSIDCRTQSQEITSRFWILMDEIRKWAESSHLWCNTPVPPGCCSPAACSAPTGSLRRSIECENLLWRKINHVSATQWTRRTISADTAGVFRLSEQKRPQGNKNPQNEPGSIQHALKCDK